MIVCGNDCSADEEGWCSSGKVHGPQGVVVNLNCLGQRLRIPTVTLTGHMAALSTAERRGAVKTHSILQLHVGKKYHSTDSNPLNAEKKKRNLLFTLCPSPVMFFVHQMVAGTESHQVGIVSWRRDGN